MSQSLIRAMVHILGNDHIYCHITLPSKHDITSFPARTHSYTHQTSRNTIAQRNLLSATLMLADKCLEYPSMGLVQGRVQDLCSSEQCLVRMLGGIWWVNIWGYWT